MAQNQDSKEQAYQRELNARREAARAAEPQQSSEPQKDDPSLFRRMGQGKLSRFGKAAMLGAALAHPSGPKGMDAFKEEKIGRQEADRQVSEERMQQEQNLEEAIFGKNASISEQTDPYSNLRDQEETQFQQSGSAQQSQRGGRFSDTDNTQQRMGERAQSVGMGVAKGGAAAGQVAGRTTEMAGKGTEMVGRGMQAGGRALERGGQAMTRAGAELSATGAGAIVGVPLAAIGGATTAVGAGVDAAGKGAQGVGKGMEQGGKAVADASGRAKDTINQAASLRKGAGAPEAGAGQNYMELARKLREEKAKALRGDVAGVAKDAVDELAKLATARALTWAWIALIPTFGLSIIYIDIHLVAHYFAGSKKFCAFGEEWMLRKIAKGGAEQVAKEASLMLEKVEVLGAVFVNILLFIVVSLSLLIGYIVLNPIEGLQLLF